MKTAGEQASLRDDSPYLAEIQALEPQLDAAFEATELPKHVPQEVRARVEDFLWRCRMARPA